MYKRQGLPLFASGFIFFAVNIVSIGYFQSVERARPAMIVTVLRGFVFMVLCLLGLPLLLKDVYKRQHIMLSLGFPLFARSIARAAYSDSGVSSSAVSYTHLMCIRDSSIISHGNLLLTGIINPV